MTLKNRLRPKSVFALAGPLLLVLFAQAACGADLAETYNVPGRTGKAAAVVTLCPSANGSYTAQACASAGGTLNGGHVSLDPGSNVIGAVTPAPTSSPGFALTAVSSSMSEASHVLKATSGNLYGFSLIAGAASGYVLLLDAGSVPADGPVTPRKCYPLAANAVLAANWQPGPPLAFVHGVTVVFSSSGCFTKTASPAAFISGEVQ